jgi:hypothetical protein
MAGKIQMFEHHLTIARGGHDSNSLMKTRPFAAAVYDLPAGEMPVPGRGVHLNENGEWEPGAAGNQVPWFLWHGPEDLDVSISGVSPATGRTHYVVHWPTGNATAFYAGGGFEFQTTEFDPDQDYDTNDPLTLDVNGIVTNENAVPYTDLICGYVTWGENKNSQQWRTADPDGTVVKNMHNMDVLTFLGAFLPAAPAP